MSTAYPGPGNPNNPYGDPQPHGQVNPYGQHPGSAQNQNASYQNQHQPLPQTPQGKKKGGCLKWGLIVGGILLVLGILASLFGETENTSAPVNEEDQSDQDSNAVDNSADSADGNEADNANHGDAPTGDLSMGETADLKGLKVTVSALRNDGVDVFDTSHVCVDVAVQNDSDKEYNFNQFDFNLSTPAGLTVDSTFTGSSDFQSAQGNPGGKHGGIVCFESDAAPGEYKVGYQPAFGLREAFWKGQL